MAKCRRERWLSLAVVLSASLGPRLLSAGPVMPPKQGLGWVVPPWPRGMGRWSAGWRVCPSRGASVAERPCPGLGMFQGSGASVCGLRMMMMAGGEEARREEESRGGKQQEEVAHRSESEGGGGGESSWLPVPSDMAEYRTLADLVNMLEEVLSSDDAKRLKPHPGSSVAALNHLKRLQNCGGGDAKKGIKQRFQKVFSIFASQAVRDLEGMNVRHHAVLLNALIYQTERDWNGPEDIEGFRSMSNKAADSVSSLLLSGKARRETAATVATLCNSLARLGRGEEETMRPLAALTLSMLRETSISSLNAAMILNAFTRLGYHDRDVFEGLAYKVIEIPVSNWRGRSGAKDLSNVANSLSKQPGMPRELWDHLSRVAQSLVHAKAHFGVQAIGNIVNAFSRVESRDVQLFIAMSAASLETRVQDYDAQGISSILNAYAKLHVHMPAPPQLILHLSRAITNVPTREWSAQSVGITANSLGRLKWGGGYTPGEAESASTAYNHLAACAIELPERRLDAQAVSNIMNAFSKPVVRKAVGESEDVEVMCERLLGVCVGLPSNSFTPQSVAVMARVFLGQYGVDDNDGRRGVSPVIKQKLSQVAQGLPPEGYNLQSVAMIASAFGSSKPHENDVVDLFRFLAEVVLVITGPTSSNSEANPRSIAHILYGFAQVKVASSPSLLSALSRLAMAAPVSAYKPLFIRMICRAIVDLGRGSADKALLEYMSRAAQSIQCTVDAHSFPATVNEFSAEDVSLIASSFADAHMRDDMLFWHLSAVAQQLPIACWKPSNLEILATAFNRLGHRDRSLFLYISKAVVHINIEDFPPAVAASLLTELARAGTQEPMAIGHLTMACEDDGAAMIFTSIPGGGERNWVSGGAKHQRALIEKVIKSVQDGVLWLPGEGASLPDNLLLALGDVEDQSGDRERSESPIRRLSDDWD